MHLSLIVPAPFDTVSGGYGYDRRIVAEVRAAGHAVDVVELTGAFPLTDEAARDSACAAWDRLSPDTRPVIDGLALPAFQGMEDALTARGAMGLIHHPVSLETGLHEADRARLEQIEQRLFPRLYRLIVTSAMTADMLATRFHIPPGRIRTVTPGTDDAPRAQWSGGQGTNGQGTSGQGTSGQGSGGAACEVLSIGTLIPRKGHDLLLRALARLFDLNWHLTIVGSAERDPPHAHGLMALAGELDVARRVTFAGELEGEALEAAWHGADLFALATQYEGYGMVIAEALKRGLPAIVTNGGAAGHLITPESGCVCPAGDRDQLSKSLRRLIFGVELRQEMAKAAWLAGQTLPSWHARAALFVEALA